MDFPERAGEATNARRANLRTALILLSIALVFFGGIIAAQYAGGTTIGIGVLGFGVLGFLLVAIGRSVRK
ncbi:MAG TPA: cytochrome oxidase small assembly protein [Casimicrobiaceae bacterium]|nr:cytochrome oxidase small assembly protein [Casimicrobiaceae bacterium]